MAPKPPIKPAPKQAPSKPSTAIAKKESNTATDALAAMVGNVDAEAALAAAKARRHEERADVEQDLTRPRINLKNVMKSVGVRTFECILIAHHRTNAFWREARPKPGQRPDCFSLDGRTGRGNNSVSDGTHECMRCPMNQFGSDDKGKGKACKNTRLFFIHRTSPRDESTAPIELLQIAPTAMAAAARYLQEFLNDDEDYFAFVTQVTAVFDPKTDEAVSWEFVRGEKLDGQMLRIAASLNMKHREEFISAKEAFEGNVTVADGEVVG